MGTEKDIELTEAQVRALRAMGDGTLMWDVKQATRNGRGFLSPLVFRALERRGLITKVVGREYRRTDAGRAALAAYEGAK